MKKIIYIFALLAANYNAGHYIETRFNLLHQDNSPLYLDQLISKALNG
jgi:hypothetical protein